MRAKRSKKYRKIMSAYQMHFSFRQPYQVLCTSTFLRQCHAFSMPVAKFLSNTLHGDARPYITQCTLAAAELQHQERVKQQGKPAGKGRGDGRPEWLPPPTEIPLRYCKHKDNEGKELAVIDEDECLADLISGQAKGNEVPKNKNHYTVAAADAAEETQKQQQQNNNYTKKRKRGTDVRDIARQIPGVPIVYVKRSVMVLEELSGISERTIRGVEKEKFKGGLIGDARGAKRKRETGPGGDEDESDDDRSGLTKLKKSSDPQIKRPKRAKGPNPLSVRKKKARPAPGNTREQRSEGPEEAENGDGSGKKRRRKRVRKASGEGVVSGQGDVAASGLKQDNGTAIATAG